MPMPIYSPIPRLTIPQGVTSIVHGGDSGTSIPGENGEVSLPRLGDSKMRDGKTMIYLETRDGTCSIRQWYEAKFDHYFNKWRAFDPKTGNYVKDLGGGIGRTAEPFEVGFRDCLELPLKWDSPFGDSALRASYSVREFLSPKQDGIRSDKLRIRKM